MGNCSQTWAYLRANPLPMIAGTYTYNNLKQELKPTDRHSTIYSLCIGRAKPSVFVNYAGKAEATVPRPAKTLDTENGTVYVFQVDGSRYFFEIPDLPAKKSTIKVYKLSPRPHDIS